MAAPSLTYTLSNGSTADASEVMQNLNDLLNGITDGTKDLTFRNLTVNGTTVLGDNTSDDVTINGSLAASVSIKTQYSYDIGTTAKGLRYLYFGSADSAARGTRVAGATVASDWNLTLPPAALVGGVLQSDGSGNTFLLHRPNIGLASGTTAVAADSIKIQGATAALSATNPALVPISSTTAGLMTTLSATADVTIDLTGAHWGLGTLGDFSDIELRVYAINDNGTLKWGVSNKGGLTTIADTSTSTTATNITTQSKILVNSALTSGTWPCREVGWFNANFDDTGGSSEDLWSVQTGAGDLNVGVPVKDKTDWTAYTPTIGPTSNSTAITGFWRRVGDSIECEVRWEYNGANSDNSAYRANLPTGKLIDSGKLTSTGVTRNFGHCTIFDTGSAVNEGTVVWSTSSQVYCRAWAAGSTYLGSVDSNALSAIPMTAANGDYVLMSFLVPVVGWSAN